MHELFTSRRLPLQHFSAYLNPYEVRLLDGKLADIRLHSKRGEKEIKVAEVGTADASLSNLLFAPVGDLVERVLAMHTPENITVVKTLPANSEEIFGSQHILTMP